MPDFDATAAIQRLAIYLPGLLLAITLHEASHAMVAHWRGDDTAHDLGRISLNPIRHFDLMGTTLLLVSVLASFPFPFGWAKPTPVNPNRYKYPRLDDVLVSLAGVASNLVLAVITAVLFHLVVSNLGTLATGAAAPFAEPLVKILQSAVITNIGLALFNLLPVPPLDGGRALLAVLPTGRSAPAQALAAFLESYGFFVVILLAVSGALWPVLGPPFRLLYSVLMD